MGGVEGALDHDLSQWTKTGAGLNKSWINVVNSHRTFRSIIEKSSKEERRNGHEERDKGEQPQHI